MKHKVEWGVRPNARYDRMGSTTEWDVRPNVEYDRMLGTIERRVQSNGIQLTNE